MKIFNGQPLEINGDLYCIHFASGYTSEQMDKIAIDLTIYENVIVAAGDDSLFKFGDHFYEMDMKMFDQSVGPWALNVLKNFHDLIGYPKECREYLHRISTEKIIYNYKDVRLTAKCFPQLPTGYPGTCDDNTLLNILMCYLSIRRQDPEKAAKELGFSIKLKKSKNLMGLTFLKGWWLPDTKGIMHWIHLPSQAIKIGKALTDPDFIFKNEPRAYEKMAFAIASSLGDVPENYPILGPFLAIMKRSEKTFKYEEPHVNHSRPSENFNWFKTSIKSFELDHHVASEIICQRYGLDLYDIIHVTQMLLSITHFPCFISHFVFNKMAEIDYY